MAVDHWVPVRFRGEEVLARCTPAGGLVVVNGMTPFVYREGGKQYRSRPDRMERMEGAEPRVLETQPEPAGGSKAGSGTRSKPGAVKEGTFTSRRSEDIAIQLWTDGACSGNPGPAGAGVLYRHKGAEVELWDYLGVGTNNIAELTAILRGLQLVDDPSTPVDVITDSAYSIGLLTKNWKAKKNPELVAELRAVFATMEDVRVLKVPGHAGVEGNERADELARRAITLRASGKDEIA